jgi:hypothetical protein
MFLEPKSRYLFQASEPQDVLGANINQLACENVAVTLDGVMENQHVSKISQTELNPLVAKTQCLQNEARGGLMLRQF